MHIANKKIDIVVIGRGPTQGLDDTTIKSEAKYFINFPVSRIFFLLTSACLGHISKDFQSVT